MEPDKFNELFDRLVKSPEGWRKVAACLVNPIRLQLKDLYEISLTKDQELYIEAAVYEASLADFKYKDAVRLQDKLVKEFSKKS